MASVIQEFVVDANIDQVWDALRAFDALHQRLVPGFVTDCHMEGSARVITFFNGMVATEQLVGIDERAHRLSYTVVGGRATHHYASAQLFAEGSSRTRFVWITDVLPDEVAEPIAAMMAQGVAVMKKTLG
jgi:carbon monoxide dehydrogenase subunit G